MRTSSCLLTNSKKNRGALFELNTEYICGSGDINSEVGWVPLRKRIIFVKFVRYMVAVFVNYLTLTHPSALLEGKSDAIVDRLFDPLAIV